MWKNVKNILTRIPLIAIYVQLISACRRLHPLIFLDGIHPAFPSAAFLRLRPPPVRSEDSAHAEDPRRDVHVHKGNRGAEEKGTGGIGGGDEFAEFVAELAGKAGLVGGLLGLEVAVEGRDDVAVDLDGGRGK